MDKEYLELVQENMKLRDALRAVKEELYQAWDRSLELTKVLSLVKELIDRSREEIAEVKIEE